MKSKNMHITNGQSIFREIFVGTLIYAVVLGFFNDYTAIVDAKSFSTIFFASVVLEILTYYVFMFKNWIIKNLRGRQQLIYKMAMFLSVWCVMFVSKFVFVWVIDMLFGRYITINGFFGILLVVLAVTVLHKGALYVYTILGRR